MLSVMRPSWGPHMPDRPGVTYATSVLFRHSVGSSCESVGSVAGLTLAEALRLPAFRRADPVVVTGEQNLARTIRWAHATEQSDVVPLLRAGDLVLTMGTGLPADDDEAGVQRFADDMAESESAGRVVELGRRWSTTLPEALVQACAANSIPLVVLTHETRFAALTQAIGEKVVDAQLDELLEAQR